MISLSHWGLFSVEKPKWTPVDNRALGKYEGQAEAVEWRFSYAGREANATYQSNNFGKLD